MPVRLVVNGYFRSGTSALWKAVRDNSDAKAFYEPCHPKLLWFVDEYKKNKEFNVLHGMNLWGEYADIDEVALIQLSALKQSGGNSFEQPLDSILKLLNILGNTSENVFLQSNRWHLQLGHVAASECTVSQIIRNPYDVFFSMRTAYLGSGDSVTRMLKYFALPITSSRVFDLSDQYCALKVRVLSEVSRQVFLRDIKPISFFEKFFFCWLVFNFLAIKVLKDARKHLLVYETLTTQKVCEVMESAGLNVKLNPDVNFFSKRAEFLSQGESFKLRRLAEEMGLISELDFVLQSVAESCE